MAFVLIVLLLRSLCVCARLFVAAVAACRCEIRPSMFAAAASSLFYCPACVCVFARAFFRVFLVFFLLSAVGRSAHVCTCLYVCVCLPLLVPPFSLLLRVVAPPTNQPTKTKREKRWMSYQVKRLETKKRKRHSKNSVFHKHTKMFIHTRHTTQHNTTPYT